MQKFLGPPPFSAPPFVAPPSEFGASPFRPNRLKGGRGLGRGWGGGVKREGFGMRFNGGEEGTMDTNDNMTTKTDLHTEHINT